MEPIKLTEEQVRDLREHSLLHREVQGPGGETVGYLLEADEYRSLKKVAYDRVFELADERKPRRKLDPRFAAAIEGIDYSGRPHEVLERIALRCEEAGLTPPSANEDDPPAKRRPEMTIRYNVIWLHRAFRFALPEAANDLIFNGRTLTAFTEELNRLDRSLPIFPYEIGESREFLDVRMVVRTPLVMDFEIHEEDRVATVTDLRLYPLI